MFQISTTLLTLDAFLKLPETEPASEYINGKIIQKPMPQGEHSVIQTELAPAINLALKSKKIARAFTELRCTFGNRSIIPDISVFMWDNIPRQENGKVANIFTMAPDWTIDIFSPDQSQSKVTKNILHCLNYGSQMGWLIDPSDESIFVYLPDKATTVYEENKIKLSVPSFAKNFEITLETIFSWLRE